MRMSSCRVRRARGFTLIELLVVIAIIAVLVGMILPAVQKVRASALRVQCANNLKQIGLAFHMYHDDHDCFPHGGISDPPQSSAHPKKRWQWNWSYHILPYLEQKAVFNEPNAVNACRSPVKTYYCPMRREPEVYDDGARTDYAGNAGTDTAQGSNGVVVRTDWGKMRRPMIEDGLSQTIVAGEKQLNTEKLGTSLDDNEPIFMCGWGTDHDAFRVAGLPSGTLAGPAPDYRSSSTSASKRFGSSHPAGFNAVFGDGSVLHIRYGVDPAVFRRACVRNDGEPYNLDDL